MTSRISSAPSRFAPVRRSKLSIWSMLDLFRQRQHLRALSDDQLNDIGISRQDALTEAARPVWDAPQHWRS